MHFFQLFYYHIIFNIIDYYSVTENDLYWMILEKSLGTQEEFNGAYILVLFLLIMITLFTYRLTISFALAFKINTSVLWTNRERW